MSPDVFDAVIEDLGDIASMRGRRWTDGAKRMFAAELLPHSDKCGRRIVEIIKHAGRGDGRTSAQPPDISQVSALCSCQPERRQEGPAVFRASWPDAWRAIRDGVYEERDRSGRIVPPEWVALFARAIDQGDVDPATFAGVVAEEQWQ